MFYSIKTKYYFNYKNNTSFYFYLWTFSFRLCTLTPYFLKWKSSFAFEKHLLN